MSVTVDTALNAVFFLSSSSKIQLHDKVSMHSTGLNEKKKCRKTIMETLERKEGRREGTKSKYAYKCLKRT